MIANNDGVEIFWEEHGEGDPVLLVQGLGYGRWGWEPLVPLLAERFRVLAFDNRGIGESAVPTGPYTAAAMASDAVAVMDDAGIDHSHVVGTSLGGMIAQEIAVDHPDRVDRLVLLSTTPGVPFGYPMPEVTVRLLAESQSLDPEVALSRFVANALGPDPRSEVIERILAHRLGKPQDPAGWAAQAAAGTTYSGGDRARGIAAPTLAISGTADRVVDPTNTEVLAGMIPDARAELVSDWGHLFFWEHPEVAAQMIIDFLEGQ